MTLLNFKFARALASVVFAMFILTACGKGNSDSSHTSVVSVEAQFQSGVDAFTAESQNQGTPVTITDLIVQSIPDFSSTSEMGVCIQEDNTTPVIQISQPYWDSLDSDGQQELLFHELGHCVLNRVHTSVQNNGIPVSIMSPIFFGSPTYVANKAQYLHELFTQTNISASLTMIDPENALLPGFSPSN